MARVQTDYRPQQAGLESIAAPMIQAVQARRDPNASGAFQLAQALGALDTQSASRMLNSVEEDRARKEREAAEAYANSITVEELGKRIKDGSMLPSQSPVFHAALQHIYGENTAANFERDTLSKLTRGEVKFETPQELEKYLVEARNGALEGGSEFTIHGFDKSWAQTRDRITTTHAKVADAEAVQRGLQEASDNLGNVLLQVTGPGFKGSKEDAAGALLDRYQLLRKSSLLRDDAAKEALSGVLTKIAESGDKDLVASVLNRKLDNGISVSAVMGERAAVQFAQAAEREFSQAQFKRVDVEVRPFYEQAENGKLDRKSFDAWVSQNEEFITTPTIYSIIRANDSAIAQQQRMIQQHAVLMAVDKSNAEATQQVRAAIDSGNLAFLPQPRVMTSDGGSKPFNVKEEAVPYMQQQAANMPFGKQVEFWTTNDVENPEWAKQIKGGVSNLASVGWQFDGKNIGQLNEQGRAAVDTFMRINKTHPGYAQKLTGGEKDYRMLSDIQFLVERMNMPLDDAAARINQIERSGISQSDYGSITKSVGAAVDDVINPGFFSSAGSWITGMFGNDQVNLTAVKADLTRMSELLVKTGQVPDAAAAVKAATEYLANPAITTKINNTLYYNKDLPQVPKGEDVGAWVERFIKESPGKLAESQKLSPKDVRLEPNQFGGYTAWIGGVPLVNDKGQVVMYRKEDVSKWIDTALTADRHKAAADRNYELFKQRLEAEMSKGVKLPGAGQGYRSTVMSTIGSREAYERFLKEGAADKPYKELLELHKKRKDK